MKLLCQMNIFDENLDDLIDDKGNTIGTIKNTESGVFLEIDGILRFVTKFKTHVEALAIATELLD